MTDREKIEQLLRETWRLGKIYSDCNPDSTIELLTDRLIVILEETGAVRMIDGNLVSFDGQF